MIGLELIALLIPALVAGFLGFVLWGLVWGHPS